MTELIFVAEEWSVDGLVQGEDLTLRFWINERGQLDLASSCCGAQESLVNPLSRFQSEEPKHYECVKCCQPVPWRDVPRKAYPETAREALTSWLLWEKVEPLTAELQACMIADAVAAMVQTLKPYYDSSTADREDEESTWATLELLANLGRTPL